MKRILLAIGILAISLCATPTLHADESHPVQTQMVAEENAIQPGRPFWTAIHLSIDKDWHTYWKNPGDVGIAPCVDWKLPKGLEVKQTKWPTPCRFDQKNTITFGYSKEVIVMTEFHPSEKLAAEKTIDIAASISWVVCSNDTCLPGSQDHTLSLPISNETPQVVASFRTLFNEGRNALPHPAESLIAMRDHDEIHLRLPETGAPTKATFFPEEGSAIDYQFEPSIVQNEGQTDVTLKEKGKSDQIRGVLVLSEGDQVIQALEIDSPIASSGQASSYGELFLLIFFGFLGGMILNLMPCVLPVLSLKVMSFVKMAGKSRKLIFQHGAAFTMGVLISFWILAGVMLILQAYGQAVGWGFQLQEPLFVATLAVILFVFALSLFGLFEIGTSLASWAGTVQGGPKGEGAPLTGSFFSGILATAVATPCTGPFLGSAIGAAMTQPALGAMAIFTSVGLGLACPYLIFAAFPPLLRFLPKPGNWMITFKEIMGFILMATVLWLLWVYGAQTSTAALVTVLAGLFTIAIGCWIYGRWASPIKKPKTRRIGIIVTLILFLLGGKLIYDSSSLVADEPGMIASHDETWEPFSEERLNTLRANGTPVFIDFTAKWCLICQANHLVLSGSELDQIFIAKGVVRMKADWTKKDPKITKHLRKFGRNGVPLYVLYHADQKDTTKVLPQVLTSEIVKQHLQELPVTQ